MAGVELKAKLKPLVKWAFLQSSNPESNPLKTMKGLRATMVFIVWVMIREQVCSFFFVFIGLEGSNLPMNDYFGINVP